MDDDASVSSDDTSSVVSGLSADNSVMPAQSRPFSVPRSGSMSAPPPAPAPAPIPPVVSQLYPVIQPLIVATSQIYRVVILFYRCCAMLSYACVAIYNFALFITLCCIRCIVVSLY